MGPQERPAWLNSKRPPQLAASFISGQSCDVADGAFQTWRDVRLRSAKRVKADVTEGTVIIATTLEVGRGSWWPLRISPTSDGKAQTKRVLTLIFRGLGAEE